MSVRWLAWVCLPVALGCGATPSADGAATPAQTADVAAAAGDNKGGQSAGTDGPGAAGNKGDPGKSGTSASGTAGAGSVPVATPARSAGATASPAASGTDLTDPDREVIAMCEGKRSMLTEKELKLLDLADHSAEEALREQAANLRARRKEMLEDACAQLRAEGKL